MTFNATILSVEQLKRAGFVEREFMRARAGMERNRILMVPQSIAQLLDGPTPPFPRFTAGVTMDTYRAGHLVSISRAADKKPDFKLLRGIDELWTLAIRKPRDFQARLFGRFVQKDIFVGTEFHLRTDLASPAQYEAIAETAVERWDALTGCLKPLGSSANSDYLGHTFRDLDEDD